MNVKSKPIKNNSIYLRSGLIIIASVLLVMAVTTFFAYQGEKQRLDLEIKENAHRTMIAAEDHITDMIASYSVNEYSKIIHNEIEHNGLFAMIIQDSNMSALLGEAVYYKGYIRNPKGEVVEYDPDNSLQNQQLREAYFSLKKNLTDAQENPLGTITVYISDNELKKRLDGLLIDNLLSALAISLLLVTTLFIMMRMQLLRPLTEIIETISHRDSDGLPKHFVPIKGPNEIQTLGRTLNHMVGAIKASQGQLLQQQEALKAATNRFQLAIDGSRDGLWDWLIKENDIYFSERFANMLGYEPEELDSTPDAWMQLIHPDDLDKMSYHINQYLKGKGDKTYESTFRMRTKQGEWRWISSRGKALFDENGEAVRFVGFNSDITKAIQQQEELQEQKNILQYYASHDPLTGLANRSLFYDRLEQAIKKSQRNSEKLAVFFIDLDNFKEINDSLGHDIGDEVLKAVSEHLKKLIRSGDTFARLGGDEFTILIEELKQEQHASILAEKIVKDLNQPILVRNHELHLGCSIGISIYPENGDNPTDLLKNADAAMYRAKNQGRNNFQYYSREMTEEAFDRLNMEANIRSGIQNDEFVVYYQPQIDFSNRKIIGMEALVRWNHPELGFIPPAKFIPVASSTGVIVELDRHVMKKAVQDFAGWHKQGLEPGRLSMNLNIKQLQREDFVEFLKWLITDSNCQARCLELEVTEGELMNNPQQSIQLLKQIDQLGITLSLDDFGTGYSSLSYLKRLPISKLKIDQSFVRDLPDDKEDAAITGAIIALAKSLKLDILAEGTENEEQVRFLSEQGCSNFQGYYFAKPMPADKIKDYLSQFRSEAFAEDKG
ncbi:GGDEF and EAL domain-containing protein [Thiomicrorhabdus xiamenensis]|uniref:cyclic-guanylate-specific phosphodiesterase n=1 Tax=Thiomicrorhabdus xiamenensis TaxID=2739063 RepID=A0A7D4SNV7_9GAMM|nr:GGDEF and EAL domain-containing protein [Thiomicrorhabdus xiamenensis]QKI89861.1 EAL domain-containing protein [Thiomicrorhabdus xiamenensis]